MVALLTLGVVDWVTAAATSLRSLFVIPVLLAAWHLGRVAGICCAVLCAGFVTVLNWHEGLFSQGISFIASDALARLVALGAVAELTVRVRRTSALATSQASRLEALIASATEVAIVGCNASGVITTFSTGAENLFARPAAEAIGKRFDELELEEASPDVGPEPPPEHAAPRVTAAEVAAGARDLVLRTPAVHHRTLRVIGAARVGADGAPAGYTLVAIDVTRERRASSALQEKNEDLEAFAYTVSHDLRAPLRGISGYASELELNHGAALGPRGQFCVTQISTAAAQLERLIQDVLHYARLGRDVATQGAVDLEQVAQGVLRELRPLIDAQGATVELELEVTRLWTWERGLAQVLTNLLDNALKFSRSATPPRVVLASRSADEGFVSISVSDNGIGFEQAYADRIFSLFNRLEQAQGYPGTGAGLAIVHRAVEKLGGRVRATSSPGRGATFTVDLPARPAGARP